MENISLVRNTVRESVNIEQSDDLVLEDRDLTSSVSVTESTKIELQNLTTGRISISDSNSSTLIDATADRTILDSSSEVTLGNITTDSLDLRSSSNNTVSETTADTISLQTSPNNTVRNNTVAQITLSSSTGNELFSDNNTIAGNTADIIRVVEDSRNNTIRDNDAAVLVAGDTSYDNVVVDNNASNYTVGIEIDGASRTIVENNTVSNTTRGIVLRGATGNPLINNTAVDSGEWDYFATGGSTDNPVTDLTVGPTVSFDSRDVALREATDPPAPPSGKAGVGAFLVVNDTGTDAWVDLTVQYTDADASGVDEESLRLWRYADGSWAPVGEDERLDTTETRVSANVSGANFGIVAPLGDATETPQNTAPTITAIPDQAVAEGDSREVAVTASDADGDTLSLSLAQAPGFVSLDDNGDGTGTITIAPGTGDAGSYTVEVVADDGTATATGGFNLTVVDGTTTHTVELIGSGTYTEYDLAVSGEITGGAGLNPVDSFSGDSASGTVIAMSDTYVFTGELTSVSIDDSATVEVDGEVVDPANVGDGDEVVYRVNAGGSSVASSDGGPDWAADTASNPSPYGNPGASDGRTYSTADSVSTTGSVPSNTPPELFQTERWDPSSGEEMQWEFPVEEGGTYEVRLYFAEIFFESDDQREFDVSGEGTLVLDDYDVHAEVGHDTGTVETVTVTSDSTLDVDFLHVINNPKLSAIEIVRLDGADNTAPSIEPIADQTVTEGDSQDVPVTASDADGDALSLSLSQAPGFVSLVDNGDGSGTISVDPEPGDSGTYTVEVVADDGTDTTTESFTLTVDEGTTTERTIEIVGSGEYTEYEFDVSGEVTGGTGLNAADSFSGASAAGTVIGGSDTYTFSGELTNLSVDGSATVRIRRGA